MRRVQRKNMIGVAIGLAFQVGGFQAYSNGLSLLEVSGRKSTARKISITRNLDSQDFNDWEKPTGHAMLEVRKAIHPEPADGLRKVSPTGRLAPLTLEQKPSSSIAQVAPLPMGGAKFSKFPIQIKGKENAPSNAGGQQLKGALVKILKKGGRFTNCIGTIERLPVLNLDTGSPESGSDGQFEIVVLDGEHAGARVCADSTDFELIENGNGDDVSIPNPSSTPDQESANAIFKKLEADNQQKHADLKAGEEKYEKFRKDIAELKGTPEEDTPKEDNEEDADYTTTVGTFGHGPVLAVLYKMACESEDMDKLNTDLTERDTWERWARVAIFPKVLQTFLMDVLTGLLAAENGGYFYIVPEPVFVTVGLTIFLFEVMTYVVGSTLLETYAVSQIDYSKMPSPRWAKFAAWSMYLSNLFVTIRLVVIAPWFIQASDGRAALILNILALSFVLTVDDFASQIFAYLAFGAHEMKVPKVVVPSPELLTEDPSNLNTFQKRFLWLNWILTELFVEIPLIPGVLSVLFYYMLDVTAVNEDTDFFTNAGTCLAVFTPISLIYKYIDSHQPKEKDSPLVRTTYNGLQGLTTTVCALACFLFLVNNTFGILYSATPSLHSNSVGFLFAGQLYGKTPHEQALECICPTGDCDHTGKTQCSCEGGYCTQNNCVDCHCEGGNCDQSDGCTDCTCDGGDCDQSKAVNATCNGGGCDQSKCNMYGGQEPGETGGGCTCNGGACAQTFCNYNTDGDMGGCTCNGGTCDQTFCNARNTGNQGGCTCDGGSCSQAECNAQNSGSEGGCTCRGGRCEQTRCNFDTTGDYGGCTCDGGGCAQANCNQHSKGNNGGCTCQKGDCNQRFCSFDQWGTNNGCTCDGGYCDQCESAFANPGCEKCRGESTCGGPGCLNSEKDCIVGISLVQVQASVMPLQDNAKEEEVKIGSQVTITKSGTTWNGLKGVIERTPLWQLGVDGVDTNDQTYFITIVEGTNTGAKITATRNDFEMAVLQDVSPRDMQSRVKNFEQYNQQTGNSLKILQHKNEQLKQTIANLKDPKEDAKANRRRSSAAQVQRKSFFLASAPIQLTDDDEEDDATVATVDAFEMGPVLAVAYKAAVEAHGLDSKNPDLGPTHCWEKWARYCIFPMLLQTFILDTLTANLAGIDDSEFYVVPVPLYVITGITIFLFEAFVHLVGPSLICLYCILQTDFSNHPSPIKTRLFIWILYLSDLAMGLRVIFTTPWFFQAAAGKMDLLLNIVATSFILHIDDFSATMLSYLGLGVYELKVPKACVPGDDILTKSNADPSSLTKAERSMLFMKWLFVDFFLDVPLIPVLVATLMYQMMSVEDVQGTGWDDKIATALAIALPASVAYKVIDNERLQNLVPFQAPFKVMEHAITLLATIAVVLFFANNALGVIYATTPAVRDSDVGFIFAGFAYDLTPAAQASECVCLLGNCDQSKKKDCTCEGGGCRQRNCVDCTCEGGGCDQSVECVNCSCKGGDCDQTYAYGATCEGGGCAQTKCNANREYYGVGDGCTCDGGACDQTFCNYNSTGIDGGCTCHGGSCKQSFCNSKSNSTNGGCSCDGGSCLQRECNSNSHGDKGGCSCTDGNCDQTFCNFGSSGTDGGCTCEHGWCSQTKCNSESSGVNGGCTCIEGCDQKYCNFLSTGIDGGCACGSSEDGGHGGKCDQSLCNVKSKGDNGGCTCVGGSCPQTQCNSESSGKNGGCTCSAGCDQARCNYAGNGTDGGCLCLLGGCDQTYCNAESLGHGGGCDCPGGYCPQDECNRRSKGNDGGCACDAGGCNQQYCNEKSEGNRGGCTCDGGHCLQTDCNLRTKGDDGGCSCAGGECPQSNCNGYADGDRGGCSCDGGGCFQSYCNVRSWGADGGCTCDGGQCDQNDCNWQSQYTSVNGGCTCSGGDCNQASCNYQGAGTAGGCKCDGGNCDQNACNGGSPGNDGGCDCKGGNCDQTECNRDSTGNRGGCTCEGGNCVQRLCNSYSSTGCSHCNYNGLHGGCTCDGGNCDQSQCNEEGSTIFGGCSCTGGNCNQDSCGSGFSSQDCNGCSIGDVLISPDTCTPERQGEEGVLDTEYGRDGTRRLGSSFLQVGTVVQPFELIKEGTEVMITKACTFQNSKGVIEAAPCQNVDEPKYLIKITDGDAVGFTVSALRADFDLIKDNPNMSEEQSIQYRLTRLRRDNEEQKSGLFKLMAENTALQSDIDHLRNNPIEKPAVIVEEDDTTSVDAFAYGPVVAVLYKMASESEGLADDFSPRDSWERWARFCVFPKLLQTFLLDIVTAQLAGENDGYFYVVPQPVYLIVGITIFIYEVFNHVMGHSLFELYCLLQTDFSQHPSPIKTRSTAWILYLSDIFITLRTMLVAPWFLQASGSRIDVLLNICALSFILHIDDFCGSIFEYLSLGGTELEVPVAVVPTNDILRIAASNPSALTLAQKGITFLKWLFTEFFLDAPLIPLLLATLMYLMMGVEDVQGTNFDTNVAIFLALSIPLTLVYKVMDSEHVSVSGLSQKMEFFVTVAITFASVLFLLNNALGVLYATVPAFRADSVGFLFAGYIYGLTPAEQAAECVCQLGDCDQTGMKGCTCAGGHCRQRDCIDCTCAGGNCDQSTECINCSCDGGDCNQIYAFNASCDGGGCAQTKCNTKFDDGIDQSKFVGGGCTCDGGACDQTFCNYNTKGNDGGCTCEGGACSQTFCNSNSVGNNGGCTCGGGACAQSECNSKSAGNNGGCTCDGGRCDQTSCNLASSGDHGGCSCAAGACPQSECNKQSVGNFGGCFCDGGGCDQQWCNSATNGTDGGCGCDGGYCDQKYCNVRSRGDNGGCACRDGRCDQAKCNSESLGNHGGCTCANGRCQQTHCNIYSEGNDGGCSCGGDGLCPQVLCNAYSSGDRGFCSCDGGWCQQDKCNTGSSGNDGGCTCDGADCNQIQCNQASQGDGGGCACAGGQCIQTKCNIDSSGDYGGCSCDGGDCSQRYCNGVEWSGFGKPKFMLDPTELSMLGASTADVSAFGIGTTGNHGGCSCDGGNCDQQDCNSFSFGNHGGCSCTGGKCNQNDCARRIGYKHYKN